jgi:hemolysin III
MKSFFALDNEPLSALTHFVGFLLAITALVLLVVFAAKRGTVWHIVGFTIFGTSLILLYLASTLFHFIPVTHRAKKAFERIDHAMIYVLIAGSYTPICFVTLRGGWGWSLFGVTWGLALIGILWKLLGRMNKHLSTLFYAVMGWLAVIAFIPLREALSPAGIAWLIGGGLFYTLGAVVYSFDYLKINKWLGLHDLWHLFVLAGSFCHFWLMLKYVL